MTMWNFFNIANTFRNIGQRLFIGGFNAEFY